MNRRFAVPHETPRKQLCRVPCRPGRIKGTIGNRALDHSSESMSIPQAEINSNRGEFHDRSAGRRVKRNCEPLGRLSVCCRRNTFRAIPMGPAQC